MFNPNKKKTVILSGVSKELKPDFYNLILITLSFIIFFSAYSTAQGYTTTLHRKTGPIILGILYITLSFSNFFAPFLIEFPFFKSNIKFLMVICGSFYLVFIFLLGFKGGMIVDVILGVGCFLIGLSGAVLWACHGKLITISATKKKVGFYSGLFWGFFQLSVVIGFGIVQVLRYVFLFEFFIIFICFGWIAFFGIVLMFFLKNKQKQIEEINNVDNEKISKIKEFFNNLMHTFKILFDIKFLLLTPYFNIGGFCYSFFFGYLVREFGENIINYVFIVWSISQICWGIIIGRINDRSKSIGMFISLLLSCLLLQFTFFLKINISNTKKIIGYFIISIFSALTDSSINTTAYSILGTYWRDELSASFSAYKFINSIGISLQLFLQNYIDLVVLQLIIFFLIIFSLVLFTIVNCIQPIDNFNEKTKKRIKYFNNNR